VPRESKILHANINRNTNIQLIQERWACGKAGCPAYCFVNDKKEHLGLSHEKLDLWATAMVRHWKFPFCAFSD
jgi:hypothetical protein